MAPCTVAAAVEAIGSAVRRGDFVEARAAAERAPIPLHAAMPTLSVGAVIFTGGESSVHDGRYQGRPVAVKRPRIGTSADLARFRRELVFLAEAQHAHIVVLLAAKALPPDYCLVLPYYPRSLDHELHARGWRPGWLQLSRLALQLASALEYLHGRGVVHRDIKPGNVLLDEGRGSAVLTDFGLAAYSHELRADADERARPSASGRPSGGFHKATMVGTLEYMAPEVLQKAPHSCASDAYAYAVALNEAATGTFPFADCTRDNPKAHTILEMGYGRLELRAAVCSEGLRPIPADDTPPRLLALLNACWAASPAQRPTFTQIVAELRGIVASLEAQEAGSGGEVAAAAGPANAAHEHADEAADKAAARVASTSATAVDNGSTAGTAVGKATDSDWHAPLWAAQLQSGGYQPVVSSGVFASAGRRGEDRMEDAHLLTSPLAPACPRAHLFAVFDGHRGPQAASFAAAALLLHLQAAWGVQSGAGAALAHAFVSVDATFREVQDREWQTRVAAMRGAAGKRPWPGATALAVLLWGDHMYTANAGDCRAVLCRNGEAVQLSTDHTAAVDSERLRVTAAGGSVQWRVDGWRVGDQGMQVTRSLGDADLKACGVTAEPEVTCTQLTRADEFVILASDGLWDKLSNTAAVELVHDTVKQPQLCAKRLVTEALARGGEDNCTAIVVYLQPVASLEKVYDQRRGHKYASGGVGGSVRRPGMNYAASSSLDEFSDTY